VRSSRRTPGIPAPAGLARPAGASAGRARAAGYDRLALFDPDLDRLTRDSTAQGVIIDEDMYDDEQDHTRCTDCNGSGYYVGFTERRACPTCDGSGFL
jgi:hypothetical protein